MTMKYIDELPIAEKHVFIRVDFNVPVEGETVIDDVRIQKAIPTIRYALGHNAKIILASHRGRPHGRPDPHYSLKPIGQHLAKLLEDVDVLLPETCVGDAVKKLILHMAPGQIVLLENLRFHPGEEANDTAFAQQLAAHIDVYINDAFGMAHRAHASTAGIAQCVPLKGAGFLVRQEVSYLSKIVSSPEKPFVVILGGAKVSDKLGIIENLLGKAQKILIGGGMAYTFLKAQGYHVGRSLVEQSKIFAAKRLLERAQERGIPILLPVDHIAAEGFAAEAPPQLVETPSLPDNLTGLDIGPQTLIRFTEALKGAKTIFWNGPMGVFEWEPFSHGTIKLAKAIASIETTSVVGGGDSLAAIAKAGVADRISYLSTGGGASLEFVEGKTLPGLAALEV